MKQLKEIKPDEIMAYSNLSLYFMKKGMITEAEEEKAAATALGFKKAAQERKERLNQAQEAQAKKQEAERKLKMFKEALYCR